MIKLTEMEKTLLRAFWTNEYVDGDAQPSTWSFAVTDNSGLAPKSAPGVFASLAQKGLIYSHDREKGESYNAVDVTKAGFDAAVEHKLIVNEPINDRDYWKGAQRFVDQFDVAEQQGIAPTEVSPTTEDIGIPKPAAKKTASQSPSAKNARRIIRNYLRTAIELDAALTSDMELYQHDEIMALNDEMQRAEAALSTLPGYSKEV